MLPDRAPSETLLQRVMLLSCFAGILTATIWVVIASRQAQRRGRTVAALPKRLGLITFDRPFPAEGRYVADAYIGSKVCAECHPGEAALQSRSGHSMTLRPAGRLALSRRLDGRVVADPEWPDVHWSYHFRDTQLEIERDAPSEVRKWVADYAIGSGHHAVTFLSVLDRAAPAVLEHRLTYFNRAQGQNELGITPGHETRPPPPGLKPYGGELPARVGRECIRCHATQISAGDDQRFDEETMIPNVSCERCHGPGKAHVAAARRGSAESELALPFGPERWTAESLLNMCGACHRLPSAAQVVQVRTDNPLLIRFQPVGLMQSLCYQKSGGQLSCITCHDPHARVSTNRGAYDATCLSCHGGSSRTTTATSAASAELRQATGTPCPVSPTKGCVECHMPRLDGGQGIIFSDHWIRVRRAGPGESTSAAGATSPP
jgi:hypothetical protein